MSRSERPDRRVRSTPTRFTFRHGPAFFVTEVSRALPEGGHVVASSRGHRKGLRPRVVADRVAKRFTPTLAHAWRTVWLPRRLGWWIAILFAVGSAHFAVGGWSATWPGTVPAMLRSGVVLNSIFLAGSLFFTGAAYLQVLEVSNADLVDLTTTERTRRTWLSWKPSNLGWIASTTQLVGTVMFNVNTADALLTSLDWEQEDLLVWVPNVLGCLFFLVSSAAAWVEYSHGQWCFVPRSVSWWIVVLNGLGSVAFLLSAADAFVEPGGPDPEALWFASLYTLVGAVFFLVGSYLLIPELSDEDRAPEKSPDTVRS